MTSQARRAEIAIAEAAEQWARQRSLTDRGCHPDFEEKAKATFLAELSRLTAQVEAARKVVAERHTLDLDEAIRELAIALAARPGAAREEDSNADR